MILVSEARTILGVKYAHLSDKEIERIIVFLYGLCKDVIRGVVNKKYAESNNLL